MSIRIIKNAILILKEGEKMKIVFMGTPEFAVPILEALAQKYDVSLVVCQADPKPGKFPAVKKKAIELGIKVFQPLKIKDDYEEILATGADVLITAAYGQFVPTKLLKKFKKCINVHGSLLPKRRGGAPIQRAIMEGDLKTGVTLIEMVKKMDAGVMYAKGEIPITEEDTADDLFYKLSILGRDLLMENICDIVSNHNLGIPQDEALATISPNLTKEEEKIDFNKSAFFVVRQINGLSSNPGGYIMINGNLVKVYKAKVLNGYNGKPGEVVSINKHLVIMASDSGVEILTLKPAGKKIMPASSYLNGQRLLQIGDVLV